MLFIETNSFNDTLDIKRRVLLLVRNKRILVGLFINFPCNETNAGHQVKCTIRDHVLSLFHFLKLIKWYLTTKFSKNRFLYFLCSYYVKALIKSVDVL